MTPTPSPNNSELKSTSAPLPAIVLGSTSIYRKQLLDKLQLDFIQDKPEIDETPHSRESVQKMVIRLAKGKAKVFQNQYSEHIIITSDQSASFNGKPVGKPKDRTDAIRQLQDFSGQAVIFYTGLVVENTATGNSYEYLDTTIVHFRELSLEVIENYIDREQPLDCAGSFKSEGLGITLFEKIESRDPNALIGLPLMALTDIFYQMGYALPRAL
ncbi:Maf family protein [Thiomicrorhabdus sediminis]|uniref:7-methyl-GTP pyrophosphatase n=1 Tax=Thiomicrorhabdus sediminis TaxID=2580412 RepID=A0A4P9K4I4_9GAMM|nr:Maf family protein [Thiomicrorhabdus sediminis]QCU89884.1 septum formation inhibitor Maf [Thiomicrorhabdus sediminis]